MKLGEALKALRGDMSLRDASKKTGISHTYLDRLEKGEDPRTGKEIQPSVSVLRTIAEAYNLPVELMLILAGYIDESTDTEFDEIVQHMANGDRDSALNAALSWKKSKEQEHHVDLFSTIEAVRTFMEDSESLTVDDLMNKYALRIDDVLVTHEEMEEMVAYIRTRRMMKNSQLPK